MTKKQARPTLSVFLFVNQYSKNDKQNEPLKKKFKLACTSKEVLH